MQSSSSWVFLTLAACQIPIIVSLWVASQRPTLPPTAKRANYLGVYMSGIVFLLQLSLWLTTLSPPHNLLKAVQSGLTAAMALLVIVALIGGLILVLSGALRPSEDSQAQQNGDK